jgi:NadR type nicotinamide-nucleotide adenylyltransferase
MLSENCLVRIVVTGPESTGKTELAQSLSKKLATLWVPEYARYYIENLHRPYGYDDVIQIARYQISQEAAYISKLKNGILIFDTWLIITKVWLELVFGRCPEWVSDHIRSSRIDLFLVCDTDLPWVADPVRENGGNKREQLFDLYCEEIRSFGFSYEIIDGFGIARTEHALNAISKHGLNLKSV